MERTVPTPVGSTRRRDSRAHATQTSLPAARPVQSARASAPGHGRSRPHAPWLMASAAIVAIITVIAVGALTLTGRDDGAITASGVEVLPGRDAMSTPCAPRVLSEEAGRNDLCDAAADRDRISQVAPPAPSVDPVDEEAAISPDGAPDPTAPDGTSPGVPDPSDPSAEPSAPDAPATPSAPGSTTPAPSAPAPSAPAPAAPVPTAPAPTVQPLAFTGLSENHAIGLFGARILSSYTLSLSGQPNATASVTYGSVRAGSVTFDGGGRASITLGRSLIDLGMGNPTVRVAYSDGTAGSEIQAPRNSI